MKYRYITFKERKSFEALYADGESLADIALKLGVHLATVYRELTRGRTGVLDKNGRCGYNADLGQKRFIENLKRRGRRVTNENKAE